MSRAVPAELVRRIDTGKGGMSGSRINEVDCYRRVGGVSTYCTDIGDLQVFLYVRIGNGQCGVSGIEIVMERCL
jgi:hypothetical protein